MPSSRRFVLAAALLLGGAVHAAPGVQPAAAAAAAPAPLAPTTAPDAQALPDPWAAAFEAFAREDAEHAPQPGGVVFVGSSSIRLWASLRQQFAGWPVVQRGFGGSQMRDCAQRVERLVAPYQPRLVILYAGDNDLEAGRTPQQVLADFQSFVDGARRRQPGLPIAFISIKPSPARSRLMGRVREANRLIRDYAQRTEGLRFVDVYSRMVDAEGRPRAELFSPDELHMNADGYALWKSAIEQSVSAASPLAAVQAGR
jgi:lysophospholipase L1-like esterase